MAKRKKPQSPEPVAQPAAKPESRKTAPPVPPASPLRKGADESVAQSTAPLPQNLLEWVEANKSYKYLLVAALYCLGFLFIWQQESLWIFSFDKILARGTAYGVYKPVNMPKTAKERAELDDLEKVGRLPDEAAVMAEMKAEIKTGKLNREELAAPERMGVDYLKKVPPAKAPWGHVQFHALPPSIYGKTASASKPLEMKPPTPQPMPVQVRPGLPSNPVKHQANTSPSAKTK